MQSMAERKIRVKDRVLEILETHRGEDISGEFIAETLGVSRTAVWKAVKSLQEEGYAIGAGCNRGYCLAVSNDILSESAIRSYLEEPWKQLPIYVYDTVASTNKTAKEMALNDGVHGTVVIANEQTDGKGRKNRSFYSPGDSGLYLSILLEANEEIAKPAVCMTAACVAVCRAVEKIYGVRTEIKWINDLYLDGKKVCGILTDGMINFETGRMEYVILGIGINCMRPTEGFPSELAETVSSLQNVTPSENTDVISRNALAAEIIEQVMKMAECEISDKKAREIYRKEYRERSCLPGKKVSISDGKNVVYGTVLDIDEDGGMVTELKDGRVEVYRSPELTVRVI